MKNQFFALAVLCLMVGLASCASDATAKVADAATDVSANAADAVKDAAATAANAATNAADASGVDPNLPKTTVKFNELTWDFGDVSQDEKVEHLFGFTNTGNEPLIISSAKGSCGCTVPEWPKEPIPPGGTGEMKVVFSSGKKKNKQTKTVTIQANTDPNPTRLTIKANILVPEENS